MKPRRAWDLCAAGLSSLCLLHCLLLPFAVALLPTVAQFSEHHLVHVVLVMLAAPVTFWVVWSVLSSGEGGGLFSTVALTGIGLLFAAVLIPPLEEYELGITLAGSLLVGGAHLQRWYVHTYR